MKKWILAISIILISIVLVICINKYQKNRLNKFEENQDVSSEQTILSEVNEVTLNTDTSMSGNTNTNNNTNTSMSENKIVSTNTSTNKENTDNNKNNNDESKNSHEKKKTDNTEETKKDVTQEKASVKSNQNGKKTVVIDPGHQKKGDSSKEPIGPGATETKAKVTTGATGIYTKQKESELVLKVALLLEKALKEEGYNVIMTRTTNNINISNKERATIANNADADAFVRLHADSYSDSSVNGISTLCQTANNKYNGDIADKSYKLSKSVLDNMVKITGAKSRGVTRTDTMSGINWSKVPVTIIEMGFLSNEKEDKLLASYSYQNKLVQGMVDGINSFFY